MKRVIFLVGVSLLGACSSQYVEPKADQAASNYSHDRKWLWVDGDAKWGVERYQYGSHDVSPGQETNNSSPEDFDIH